MTIYCNEPVVIVDLGRRLVITVHHLKRYCMTSYIVSDYFFPIVLGAILEVEVKQSNPLSHVESDDTCSV